MRQCRWLEFLSDYNCEIRYHPGKANVVADALSRKEREPLRVPALVMTIGLDLPKQILEAQTEARKPENLKTKDVRGQELLDKMYQDMKKLYWWPNMKADIATYILIKFLEVTTEGLGYKLGYEHCLSSGDGQTKREDYSNSRGYATRLRDRLWK
ncbi:putative reverse transcriptase domain-containing protein [Tanacetum coccineum]